MDNKNIGYRSTGNYSTGDYSTGDRSTGNCSTGYCSTGYRSTGNCSISKYSSGNFSTIDYSGYGWFDKPCSKMWSEVDTPHFLEFKIAYWIKELEMTDEEKEENETYKTTSGFLKSVDYKTAWKIFWRRTDENNRKKFLNLPNFDPKIFKEITGIDVDKTHTIKIDGKEIELSEESFKELKKQLT